MVCAESESALALHWSGSNAACSPYLHDPWHSYVFVFLLRALRHREIQQPALDIKKDVGCEPQHADPRTFLSLLSSQRLMQKRSH